MDYQIISLRSHIGTFPVELEVKNDISDTTMVQPMLERKSETILRSNEAPNESVVITDSFTDVRIKFHIGIHLLGRGCYGIVRRCMERETKDWYAIKSISKSTAGDIDIVKREIAMLREVQHPNIVQLKEVHEDERFQHLITELCTGGDLFDRIVAKRETAEGHFSENETGKIIYSILHAISYCHNVKGIAHRDLKPENIMFATPDDDSPIKIIDFGLSRHDTITGYMTTMAGTTRYVAPEVLDRKYTKSCDIWSIGVITYILLCGFAPFDGDDDAIVFKNIRARKFDFPSPEWDTISNSAKEFVSSLLTLDRFQRPTAAEAMKHGWIQQQMEIVKKKENIPQIDNVFNIFCGATNFSSKISVAMAG